MRHIIVGTAGHVDHGKTALTAALTGIDTDRLPEEKRRGVTIELGFVPLDLADGQRLGLIDVPGHERFVKNMLAGVAGIDVALLVIAADEGVMPQTEEHLHILHLLGIQRGVIALSKCDLVDDEWLELVKEQVEELVRDTTLADAPLIPCSALTGQGLEELRRALAEAASLVQPRTSGGHARLPIDRVFSKAGFGTVITGTLWMGSLHTGDTVQLWPGKREARVRGLQVHGAIREEAQAGERTAINLSGVEMEDAPRGGWLAAPGLLRESFRLDVELRLLDTAPALAQRCRMRVHHGTAEALGRVHLLDREELAPGETCLCQLVLETPLPPLRGDRLILRSYSPMVTIAGATVLDPNPPRHKRYREDVLSRLEQKSGGGAAAGLLDVLAQAKTPLDLAALAAAAQLPAGETADLVEILRAENSLYELEVDGEANWLHSDVEEQRRSAALRLLSQYHEKYPLRQGIPVAELRSRTLNGYSQKQAAAILGRWQEEELLLVGGAYVRRHDFQVQLSPAQEKWIQAVDAAFTGQLFAPPDWNELTAGLHIPSGEKNELLIYVMEQNVLVKIGELLFAAAAPSEAESRLRAMAGSSPFTLAQARDVLGSSRKYVLPLLEYLDSLKLTRREGEARRFN